MENLKRLQILEYPDLLKILSGLKETQNEGLIFIGGVHGTGKTSLASKLSDDLHFVNHISASDLINWQSPCKCVENISDNQTRLWHSFCKIKKDNDFIIFDGHFNILNSKGILEFVGFDIFRLLSPDVIILLEASAEGLHQRLLSRDSIRYSMSDLKRWIAEERTKAIEIAEYFKIPLLISKYPDQFIVSIPSQINPSYFRQS